MDRYLANLRRKRKLVGALVAERQNGEKILRQQHKAGALNRLAESINGRRSSTILTAFLLQKEKSRALPKLRRLARSLFNEKLERDQSDMFRKWRVWLDEKKMKIAAIKARQLAEKREAAEKQHARDEYLSELANVCENAKRPISKRARRRVGKATDGRERKYAALCRFQYGDRKTADYGESEAVLKKKRKSSFLARPMPSTETNWDPDHAGDVHFRVLMAATRNNLELVKRLVESEGAGLFARGQEGETAVHHCVRHDNLEMLKYMVKCRGGVQNQREQLTGRTPVHIAAQLGHKNMVMWMWEQKGFDFTMIDNEGMTVVHHAVLSGKLPLVKWLVVRIAPTKAGPLICNGADCRGCTPLDFSRSTPNKDIQHWLSRWYQPWLYNSQRKREIRGIWSDSYDPTSRYQRERACNRIQREIRRYLAKSTFKKTKVEAKSAERMDAVARWMPANLARAMQAGRRNSIS